MVGGVRPTVAVQANGQVAFTPASFLENRGRDAEFGISRDKKPAQRQVDSKGNAVLSAEPSASGPGDGRVALRVTCREPAGALDEKKRPPVPAASATACDLVKPSKARVFSKLRLDTGDCVENLPQVGSEMLRQCLLHHP